MIDSSKSRPHEASNCIHAVTDLPIALDTLGMAFTGTLHGIQASLCVYQYLSPFFVTRLLVPRQEERLVDQLQRAETRAIMAQTTIVDAVRELLEKSEEKMAAVAGSV
jgi:hypothetical protein